MKVGRSRKPVCHASWSWCRIPFSYHTWVNELTPPTLPISVTIPYSCLTLSFKENSLAQYCARAVWSLRFMWKSSGSTVWVLWWRSLSTLRRKMDKILSRKWVCPIAWGILMNVWSFGRDRWIKRETSSWKDRSTLVKEMLRFDDSISGTNMDNRVNKWMIFALCVFLVFIIYSFNKIDLYQNIYKKKFQINKNTNNNTLRE